MNLKNKRKNFIWNMFGIGIYAVTSLIFMIIVTRINGVDDAGIFSFGFSFACMIQIVGTYGGRTYQVTDISGKTKDCDYLYLRVVNCATMLLCTFIFLLFKDYSLNKVLVIVFLVVYKMIFAYSDTIFGIFQKNDNLYQVGISLTIRSIFTVVVFIIVDMLTYDLILSTISLMLSELMVFIFFDCLLLKKYEISFSRVNKEAMKLLFVGGFSVFVFMLLSFILINIPKFAIDDILNDSDQAIFGIILMPATLISICANFIVQPFINEIKTLIEQNKYLIFRKLIFKICMWVFVIGMFVLIVTYFVGIPILNFIYGIQLDTYLFPLLVIVFGAVFNGLLSVLTNALISIRKNGVQVAIYIFCNILMMVLSYSLVLLYNVMGASVAYCIIHIVLFCMYFCVFMFYIKKLLNKS